MLAGRRKPSVAMFPKHPGGGNSHNCIRMLELSISTSTPRKASNYPMPRTLRVGGVERVALLTQRARPRRIRLRELEGLPQRDLP